MLRLARNIAGDLAGSPLQCGDVPYLGWGLCYATYMIRPAAVAIILLSLVMTLTQPTSSAQQTIRLEVRLSYDDTRQLTAVEGTAGVSASTRTGGGQTPARGAATEMQMQVQLQDGFGRVVEERHSGQDGRVFFDIFVPAPDPRRELQSTPIYRLRVSGPAIDEVIMEGVDPIHGERVVHISLHRKEDKSQPEARASAGRPTVSLRQLQVPPKAGRELEKGNRALKDGDLDAAERHFNAAIKAFPDYDQAYNNLGVVLIQKGSTEEARRAFEKAIAVNDRFARAFTNLGKLALMQQNHAEADGFLRRSLENDPRNPEALMLAAEAALFIGKLDDAINDVLILHTLPHEKYALGHFIAGRAYEAQAKPAEASAEYQLFLNEEPDSPNAARAREALRRLKAQP